MLASDLSRRVSQHIFAAETLLGCVTKQVEIAAPAVALLSASLLQLELALLFYLHEVSGSRAKNIRVDSLSISTLEAQLQGIDSDSVRELLASARQEGAPIAVLMNQLAYLRLCKNQADTIQNPMFSSDLVEVPSSEDSSLLIATSHCSPSLIGLNELQMLVGDIKALIGRHRSNAEEY